MKIIKELSRTIRQPINKWYAFRRLNEFHAKKWSLGEIIEWAMNFGGGGYMTIRTQQIPYEITKLAQTVRDIKPRIILEIGTAHGGTLLIWSQMASQRVISCDINDTRIKSSLLKRLPPPSSNCKVTLLTGDTHTEDFKKKLVNELKGDKVDFLFIDGDHTESGVETDFNNYVELVRPGGLIAFHDIIEKQPHATNQVYYFWNRIKNKYKHEEFIADQDQCGFGIGVLHIPYN